VGYRWPLTSSSGITTGVGTTAAWDLTSLKIASDHLSNNQAHGVSGHIDFMSGWSDAALLDLMKTCFWSENHVPAGIGPNQCGAVHDADAPFYGEN
jgi:hypothetical protein